MSSKVRLPVPLKQLLDEPAPERSHERWQAIKREQRARKLRRRTLGGALAVAALTLLVYVGKPESARAPVADAATPVPALALVNGAPLDAKVEPTSAPQVLHLNDGSHVTVAPSARLEVLQTSATRAEFALRSGRVRFEIRPHGPRVWRIDCGPLSIEVLGTAFDVKRDEQGVSVEVLRGAVLVRGEAVPDAVQRLERGQKLSVPSSPAERAGSRGLVPAAPSEPTAAQAQATVDARAQTAPAPERRTRKSSRTAEEPGDAKQEPAEQVIARLLREADEARMAGRPADALAPLTEIARRYPRDPEAALAAFALARLRLDVLDQPGDAVIHLERALSLHLPEPLAEDARARLVEALSRVGATSEACTAADDYRIRYPEGTRKSRVERYCSEQRPSP